MGSHALIDGIEVAHNHAGIAWGHGCAPVDRATLAALAPHESRGNNGALEVSQSGLKGKTIGAGPGQRGIKGRTHVLDVIGKDTDNGARKEPQGRKYWPAEPAYGWHRESDNPGRCGASCQTPRGPCPYPCRQQ